MLDLADTDMQPTSAQLPRVATGYTYVTNPPSATFAVATSVTDPPPFLGGGGGLRTTADDMVRFLTALLAPPHVAHLATAIPATEVVSFDGPAVGGGTATTGLGWDPITSVNGTTILFKNGGGSDGFYTLLGICPATGRGMFFNTNVAALDVDLAVPRAFAEILGGQSDAPRAAEPTFTG